MIIGRRHAVDLQEGEEAVIRNVTRGRWTRVRGRLERLFHRDLHELQRLQAARNGQLVAAPMVMDIDLDGAAGATDGSSPSRGD